MPRLNSFFLFPNEWPCKAGDTVSLSGPEARHMGTVLRTEKNQTVRLFDGMGHEGLFSVVEISKNQARLEALELKDHPVPTSGLTLAIGWGKSKRRGFLFEKAVELKGLGIILWQALRSQGSVPKEVKETWTDKCVQAAKQCGNPFIPVLETVSGGVDSLIGVADRFDHCYLAWEAEEAIMPLAPAMLSKGPSLVVIGPEGGFDRSEAEKLIHAGFTPVTLGSSILRWETAALYCLSLAMYGNQDT